jgi:tRNA splicing ligase
MKKELQQLIKKFSGEISQASANGFEAVMLPCDDDYESYCLDYIEDEDYIYDLADEFGWNRFAIIDLLGNKSKIIDLCLIEAA